MESRQKIFGHQLAMRDHLPDGAIWAAFGIGAAQFPMVAQAVLLGGHVRVGFEDNLYLARDVPAPSNAALVEKAARIIQELGQQPASASEARHLLGHNEICGLRDAATG